MRVGAVLLTAVLIVGGCASTPATPPSATPAAHASTFASKELRFSVTYDAGKIVSPSFVFNPEHWASIHFAQVPFLDRDPKDHPFPASLVDPSGPPGGPSGYFVVGVWWQPIEPSSADLHEMLATSFTAQVMSDQKGVAATTAVPVVYNGLPGYRSALSWKGGDSVTYILYKKPLIYELELTVADAARPSSRDALKAALQSFKVTR